MNSATVPDRTPRRGRRWPESTTWFTEVPHGRWQRGWGNLGADVLRRQKFFTVKIYRLNDDRTAVGEPDLGGVYDSEGEARRAADVYLGVRKVAKRS